MGAREACFLAGETASAADLGKGSPTCLDLESAGFIEPKKKNKTIAFEKPLSFLLAIPRSETAETGSRATSGRARPRLSRAPPLFLKQ